MADFGAGEVDRGTLSITHPGPGVVTVLFVPSKEVYPYLRVSDGNIIEPVKLLEFDADRDRVSIYPIGTVPERERFTLPKYRQIRAISIPLDGNELPVSGEDVELFLLEKLPRGFTNNYQFGLGFPREYEAFVDAVESLTSCQEIRFTDAGFTAVVDDVLVVPLSEFEVVRSELHRILRRAQVAAIRVKQAYAHNWLAERTGQKPVAYKRGRHPMVKKFSDAAADKEPFEEDEIDKLIEVLALQSKSITVARPGSLAKLRGDIELVELDGLISRFEEMLKAGHGEKRWQKFFVENPFILSFSFGYPFILVQDQASVGGRKLSGTGEKIADFLMKNPATNNVAIFEIKKPGTKILQRNKYRGGVYGPSKELAESITQILDQRYQLTRRFPEIKDSSRLYDIESFSVHACLIAGETPGDFEKAKSFELFRNSLRDVEVITFDELLQRAKLLRSFLSGSELDAGVPSV